MLLFPEASVTVQITVVVPKGYEVGALFVTLETVQLSAVNGFPNATPVTVHELEAAFTFISIGAVMVGKVSSITFIVWFTVAVLPAPSVTVQTTEVYPNGKVVV